MIPAFSRGIVAAIVLSLGAGCATVQTTDSGAIGLERKQYFAEGTREAMVASAALSYDKILNAALRAGALNRDPAQVERAVTIANRLIPHVHHFRPDAVNWDWEINVLSDDDANATCMAGGKIFVFTGLLEQWQPNDDELAAVIGHEIGHALRDHTAEKYSTHQRNNTIALGLSSVLSIGLAVATGVDMSRTLGQAGQISAQAFANLPNSRELEHESDHIGLELMARGGYDPLAAASLWQKVAERAKAAGNDGGSDFWSTHPADDKRVAELLANEPRVRHLYLAARDAQPPVAAESAAQSTTQTTVESAPPPATQATASATDRPSPKKAGATAAAARNKGDAAPTRPTKQESRK